MAGLLSTRPDVLCEASLPAVFLTVVEPVYLPSKLSFALPQCFPLDGTGGGGARRPDRRTYFSVAYNGGRDRDRTCDPYDVNVVLFR
jgi:hypothetical protein